ncbi:hypothetical protein ABMA79_03680 [Halobacteriovorax sp. HFRX-2_2]|uniref:tetratricopeptide repeat protein n=1 Tax=unclassified Halobacteriovorax TaxID=2639665 RepID=UPI003710CF44
MNWREILLGALITLGVTVIGGLITYEYTRLDIKESKEVLTYNLEDQVSFEGGNERLSIGIVKFANIGNIKSENIKARLKISSAEIDDYKVHNDKGATVNSVLSQDKKLLEISVNKLLPEERITITYLLNKKESPEFSLRSDSVIGKRGMVYKLVSDSNSILNNFLGDFTPLLMLPLLFYFLYFRKVYNKPSNCRNNTGFVLLHKGVFDEAQVLLKDSILSGDGGALALSNYAVTLAIDGKYEESKRYIEASKFYVHEKSHRAVCLLNESFVLFKNSEVEKSLNALKESLKLSKRGILEYLNNSVLWKEVLDSDRRFSEVVAKK